MRAGEKGRTREREKEQRSERGKEEKKERKEKRKKGGKEERRESGKEGEGKEEEGESNSLLILNNIERSSCETKIIAIISHIQQNFFRGILRCSCDSIRVLLEAQSKTKALEAWRKSKKNLSY